MNRPVDQTSSPERGAIIIHVAIALLALIVFSAFVVDYGVMWVARTQAQAAADAGALAGALTLSQYNVETQVVRNAAMEAAQAFVAKTAVWGQAVVSPDVFMTVSSDAAPLAPASQCSHPGCLRVDVMRGVADRVTRIHTNYLPTFFAQLVGITHQGVRATATAQVTAGNATNCLKPWLIRDRWADTNNNHVFDPGEVYTAPTLTDPGTGYTTANIGSLLELKPGDPSAAANAGDYYTVGDGAVYQDAITGCTITAQIGDSIGVLPGDKTGLTVPAVNQLIASDPGYWNSATNSVVGSNGQRIVPIGLFSPVEFAAVANPSGFNLTLVNILGLFVNDVQLDGTIHGYIVGDLGILIAGGSTLGPTSTFIKIVRLVQ